MMQLLMMKWMLNERQWRMTRFEVIGPVEQPPWQVHNTALNLVTNGMCILFPIAYFLITLYNMCHWDLNTIIPQGHFPVECHSSAVRFQRDNLPRPKTNESTNVQQWCEQTLSQNNDLYIIVIILIILNQAMSATISDRVSYHFEEDPIKWYGAPQAGFRRWVSKIV